MARLTFPDEGSRLAYDPDTGKLLTPGTKVYLYLDSAATQAATDLVNADTTPNTTGFVQLDAYRRLPLFSGPDSVDTLWAVVNGGPVSPIYARTDDRLDGLASRVGALEADNPATAVQSVNGHTGTSVTLSAADVGAATTAALAAETSRAQGVEAAKADLVGGKVPSAQIPSISFVTAHPVANQAAMLALTGVHAGEDIAVRQDGAGSFLLTAADPTQLASWTLLVAPTDAVTSVAGRSGAVVLAKADVGLGNVDNTSDVNKPVSTAQAAADTAVQNAAATDATNKVAAQATTDRGTYVAWTETSFPIRFGACGDSTTAGGLQSADGVSIVVGATPLTAPSSIGWERAGGYSWATHLALISQGQLILNHNGGVGSDVSTGCLSRLPAELALGPTLMFLPMGVRNDINTAVPLATSQANVKAAVTACRNAGVVPVLMTLFPDNAAGNQTAIRTYNQWVKAYALRNNLRFVDVWGSCVDPTSAAGNWLAAFTQDGTHPTPQGAQAAAQAILNQLINYGICTSAPNPAVFPFLAQHYQGVGVHDANNLLFDPLFTGAPTSGLAQSWTATGTGSIDATPGSGIVGSGQIITAPGGNAPLLRQDISVDNSLIHIGDRIAFSGLFKTTGCKTAGTQYSIGRIEMLGAATISQVYAIQNAMNTDQGATARSVDFANWTPFYLESVIGTGTTAVRHHLLYTPSNAAAGPTWEFAQVRSWNLTTLGF